MNATYTDAARTDAAWAFQAAANTNAAHAAQAAAAGKTDAARTAQAAAAVEGSLTPSTIQAMPAQRQAVQQSQSDATAEMVKQITSYQTFANSQASTIASSLHFSPRKEFQQSRTAIETDSLDNVSN